MRQLDNLVVGQQRLNLVSLTLYTCQIDDMLYASRKHEHDAKLEGALHYLSTPLLKPLSRSRWQDALDSKKYLLKCLQMLDMMLGRHATH